MREKSAHSHIKMLSDEQMQAAKAAVGPVLVTGGPGTGKSVALMARLSGILNSGASASQILFLTTNARRAADLRVELPSFLRRFSPNVLPEVLGKVQPTILENLTNSLLRRYGPRFWVSQRATQFRTINWQLKQRRDCWMMNATSRVFPQRRRLKFCGGIGSSARDFNQIRRQAFPMYG